MWLSPFIPPFQKSSWLFWICTGFLILPPLVDLLEAYHKSFSFYLSESLLFSLFWWLFIPGLLILRKLAIPSRIKWTIPFAAIMLHVLLFSMLVGGLSAIFRSQAYSIQSTITYAALEHGISALVIYVVALFFLSTDSTPENTLPKQKTESLWVYYRDEKIKLMLSEIIFVKSERPYLALITQDKKYLYSSSLKGFMEKWTTSDFVQIHKSTIINPSYITSFRSRKNGDYDFFLEGGHNVRASRHFKQQYGHLINSS